MNKEFEQILERLDEERELSYADFSRYVEEVSPCLDAEYDDFFHRGLERASRLVKEVAEEYNGGWIACSDRLPEECTEVLVSVKEIDGSFYTKTSWMQDGVWVIKKTPLQPTVIAWQPLPEPFKEHD